MSSPDPLHEPSRRAVLAAGASLASLGWVACLGGPARAAPRAAREDGDELLDRAYERIAARFSDRSIHRSNHAPMVSEALRVLGRADAIAPWLDRSLSGALEATPGQQVERERWREALGRSELYSAWQALFLAEFEAEDWKLVVRRWVPRLAPGLAGAATHGLIRTGHAARALAGRDNPIRRRELATGLAYWAVSFQELPWDGSLAPQPSVEAALAKVPVRRPALAPPRGNIISGLRALNETASFRVVAGLVDTQEPLRTLSEISAAFARLYLRNPEHRIAFTHAVTAPSALRLLAPYLDGESLEAAVRLAWQAAAGLHVFYGDPQRAAPEERAPGERHELVARAVENGGAHAIKLTEACLREEALAHDPVFLAAARDAGEAMHG